MDSVKKVVKEYISDLMVLIKEERLFLEKFESSEYIPELIFDDSEILDRIKNPIIPWHYGKQDNESMSIVYIFISIFLYY